MVKARTWLRSWIGWGTVALVLLPLTACSPRNGGMRKGLTPADPVAHLRQRAERYWKAKQHEDWATVFELLDPAERMNGEPADFAKWCTENEPFVIHAYTLGQVLTENDFGWVEVAYNCTIRQYANLPPRDAKQWQKWRRVEGQWYPVPRKQLEAYPLPPIERDLDEEPRLRARFEKMWDARVAGDHQCLWNMVDPNDRKQLTVEQIAEADALSKWLDHKVHWVQVVKDTGTVLVTYKHKLQDPNLKKMPAQYIQSTETWIKVDGEWYRRLGR